MTTVYDPEVRPIIGAITHADRTILEKLVMGEKLTPEEEAMRTTTYRHVMRHWDILDDGQQAHEDQAIATAMRSLVSRLIASNDRTNELEASRQEIERRKMELADKQQERLWGAKGAFLGLAGLLGSLVTMLAGYLTGYGGGAP